MIYKDIAIKEVLEEAGYTTFEVACCMFRVFEEELESMGIETNPSVDEMAVSKISFNGTSNGTLVLSVCEGLFDTVAVNMLGQDTVSNVERDSALCEITNIIAGNVIDKFTDVDELCVLSPPVRANNVNHNSFLESGYEAFNAKLFVDEGVATINLYLKK